MANKTVSPFAQIQDSLPPLTPAPPPISAADLMGLGGNPSVPNVFAPAPKMTLDQNPQHQVQGAFANGNPSEGISLHEQQKLAKDYQKDADPYGSPDNHPGFFGKLAHGLNVATGGVNRRNDEEMGLQKSLRELLKEQSTEAEQGATAAHLNAETPEIAPNAESLRKEQGAEAEHAGAEAANLENPSAVMIETDQGIFMRNPKTNELIPLTYQGQPLSPFQKDAAQKGLDHVNLQDASGRLYGASYNPNNGKYYDQSGKEIANPVPYEKPISVNAGDASLDRLAGRLGKPYQTSYDAATGKFDRITQTLHSLDAGYTGQALAIPELLTALVSGQGSGVRVTQSELNAITANRGLGNNAEGWFNSLVGKGKLTDQDKGQIRAVLGDARRRLETKQSIVSEALDSINGANSRSDIQQADRLARQRLNEYERYGFYSGQQTPAGVVTGFKDGKIQVSNAQ